MKRRISAKKITLLTWYTSSILSLVSFGFITLIFFVFKEERENNSISILSFGCNLAAILTSLISALMSHSAFTIKILKRLNVLSAYIEFITNSVFMFFLVYLHQYADILLFLYLALFLLRLTITIWTNLSRKIDLEKMYLDSNMSDMSETEYQTRKSEMSKTKIYFFIIFFLTYGISKIEYMLFPLLLINLLYTTYMMLKLQKTIKLPKSEPILLYILSFIIFIFLVSLGILMKLQIVVITNTSYKDVSMFTFAIYIPYIYLYQKNKRNLYLYESLRYINNDIKS